MEPPASLPEETAAGERDFAFYRRFPPGLKMV